MTQRIYPYLLYHSCEDALEFLSRAFGFEEVLRYTGEQGYVTHAETKLGDAHVMMGNPGEEFRNPKEQGGETVGLYVYVDDVDRVCRRAVEAGARSLEEPADLPYGDRRGMVADAWGNTWQIATHRRFAVAQGTPPPPD